MDDFVESERVLKKRVKFFIPPFLAVLLILAYLYMGLDSFATRNWLGVSCMSFIVAALIVNIVIRHRLQTKLNNLSSLRCYNCGYDLRATPDRCPECGTIPPKR